MGWLSRLFGGGGDPDDEPVPDKLLNQDVRRGQLAELESALADLVRLMDAPDAPVDNPGWRGRARDFSYTLGSTRLLLEAKAVTKEGLYELISTVRPLYRGAPPPEYAHLAACNERIVAALRVLESPAPGE